MKVLPIESYETKVTENKVTDEKKNEKIPSDLPSILKYMKAKFPSFVLFLHICISKYVFICESEYSNETLDIIYVDNEENNLNFWIYFVCISILCFLWEFFYHYLRKTKCTKRNKLSRNKLWYSLFSSIISLIAFQSTLFYMDDNKVFNCFIDYNETIANLFFFICYGFILFMAVVEYYCCPTLYNS